MKKQLLYRFFEGVASSGEEERIRAWMEKSPRNAAIFFNERKLYDASILLTRHEAAAVNRISPLRRVIVELSRIAAAVLIVAGVGWAIHVSTGFVPDSMQTISVPAGQRVNVILPDGTNVWLNSLSTFQYPTSFGRKDRRVILDGEAYMEVKKDAGKKFIVSTDKGRIEVLGTSFTVDAYSKSDVFETSLIEGKLNVWGNSGPADMVELAPRMKASLVDGRLQAGEIIESNRFDWQRGLISFENRSLAQIMSLFERYYGVTISIENEKIQERTYTGKFRQADGIDYALRVMKKDIGFTYTRDNENSVIRIE
jgi:ferric-dicitrate binding protein FerR (iron transport regulator)